MAAKTTEEGDRAGEEGRLEETCPEAG